ncbi:IQ domain-containing protein C [Rhinoraja longicauda]
MAVAAAGLHGVCRLQAYVRGYLIRKKFRSLRQDYESIVKEIEGGLDILEWDGKELPRPKFRNQIAGVDNMHKISKTTTSEALCPEADESADCSLMENDEPVKDSCEDRNPSNGQSAPTQLDVPSTLSTDTSSHWEAAQTEGVSPLFETEEASCADGAERKVLESCTTVLSACGGITVEHASAAAVPSEMQDAQNEPLYKLQRKEMPAAYEDLQNYRSNLAMELLWLQQAIASRKNYLILKQRLGAPER